MGGGKSNALGQAIPRASNYRVLRTGSGGDAISIRNQAYTTLALWPVLPWGLPVRAWVVQATAYSARSCLAPASSRA